MLRALLNLATRIIGWSIIGRVIIFRSGDDPLSIGLHGLMGIVKNSGVDEFGREVILVKIVDGKKNIDSRIKSLCLVPRHKAYGVLALATTTISVYVFSVDESSGDFITLSGKEAIASVDVGIAE